MNDDQGYTERYGIFLENLEYSIPGRLRGTVLIGVEKVTCFYFNNQPHKWWYISWT
jgi:hypothetical protein